MIVELRRHASAGVVDTVRCALVEAGAVSHEVTLKGRRSFVVPDPPAALGDLVGALAGVDRVVAATRGYELAARPFRPHGTVVCAAGVPIGDGGFVVAAGPCAVETPELLATCADLVADGGAALLRGGAVKPRSSPYAFQGLGIAGLRMLAEQRSRTGLRVVTEVLEPAMVGVTAEYADVLQVGTRNMQNFPLLRELGRCGRPVLLKRGLGATVDEWLLAAEYLLAAGNPDVVLCERGIRTFETATRFTLDLGIVPVLKHRTHLPVLVDPSHACGLAHAVPALALAAAAAGADGLLIDVHPQRSMARCDADQALDPAAYMTLTAALRRLLGSLDRVLTPAGAADDCTTTPDTVLTTGRRPGGLPLETVAP